MLLLGFSPIGGTLSPTCTSAVWQKQLNSYNLALSVEVVKSFCRSVLVRSLQRQYLGLHLAMIALSFPNADETTDFL